ncbi:hypothetical protein ACSBR1_010908 [Camellia fascicularis]
MEYFESLDLSSIQLSSVIPPELTSISFLEVLNFSYNDLLGIIPRGFPYEAFGDESYRGCFVESLLLLIHAFNCF